MPNLNINPNSGSYGSYGFEQAAAAEKAAAKTKAKTAANEKKLFNQNVSHTKHALETLGISPEKIEDFAKQIVQAPSGSALGKVAKALIKAGKSLPSSWPLLSRIFPKTDKTSFSDQRKAIVQATVQSFAQLKNELLGDREWASNESLRNSTEANLLRALPDDIKFKINQQKP
jgi:hypothetical protein